MRVDVIVLGAGIVGTATALDLALRGRKVALIDRGQPGAETSYGNAGLIQREAVLPYAFPRDPLLLTAYALQAKIEAHYHATDALKVAPFLWRYFRASGPDGQLKTARANTPLFTRCLEAHDALAKAAGLTAQLRHGGWIKLFRSQKTLDIEVAKMQEARDLLGLQGEVLDARALAAREPALSPVAVGGIHWHEPYSLADPQALTLGYARHLEALGGIILNANALTLAQENPDALQNLSTQEKAQENAQENANAQPSVSGHPNPGTRAPSCWSIAHPDGGRLYARDCVVALGPWAPDLLNPMGYKVPMGYKRGYHVHFHRHGETNLTLPVLDADTGFLLAPMARGIRMTTGAEFAGRDAPATPIQVDRAEPHARALMPLGARVEAMPWLGARPCMPDMLCVLGAAERHNGLWFNFGHAHHGLTLAAICGRLIGDLITGAETFTDPAPYRLERFN